MVKNKEYSKTSVTRALEIAINAHRGQFDIAGVEYIRHLMAVAASLNMKDPDAVVVALLHDVLEGTVVTVEDLAKDFPPKIINALRALTPQAGEDYMSFIPRCAENPLARMVKIADLRHDMDPGRLKNVKKDDRKQLRTKYASALNYLCRFIDKEELSRLLFEESSGLPSGTLPHDAMNKAAFVHDEMLESFLRYYVEESFIKDLDLTHIESLPG